MSASARRSEEYWLNELERERVAQAYKSIDAFEAEQEAIAKIENWNKFSERENKISVPEQEEGAFKKGIMNL